MLYNSRAAAHLGTGQLKEAVADCQQAINRDPNFLRAYLRRARILAVSTLNAYQFSEISFCCQTSHSTQTHQADFELILKLPLATLQRMSNFLIRQCINI